MADKHILRIHDTQANLIAELKDKQIAWATDINEAIWRNGTNFHFLSSGKYWDGTQFVFDNIDAGKVSLFDRTAGTILGELDADGGTFTINFAGSPINVDASSLDLTGVSVTADDPTLAQEVATKNYVDNATPATPGLQDVTDQGSTTTNSITAAGVISSTDLFQSSSANVSLANNTLGGVTFYGATSELNSTGGRLRLGNSLVPIEQQFLKATDKGAVYTGLKMLAKDTTTNEVFMADVPSVGGSQDLQEVTEIGRSTNQGVQLLELQSSFAAPYSNDSELFTQAGSDAPPSEWIGSVTQIAGYIGAGAQFTGGSIISTTGVNEDVQGFFGCSFWLRVDQNTGGDNEQVLSHYDPVNDVDFRFFEYGNTLGMAVRDGGSFPKNWAVQTSGTYSSLVGTGWHHVMGWMSMDGSDVKLYIDGVLQTNYQFVQPLVVQNPTYTQRGVGGNTSGSEILSGISVSNVYTSVDPQFANEVSTYYAQGQAPDLLLYSVAGVLKGKENGIEFNLNSPNITQDLETTLAEGNTTGDNKVTFETHTNGSPTNGDVWYDGTNLQVQSAALQVSGQTLVGANYLDLEDSTGWGVRIDGSNNALRPIVNLDTGLGLSSRQFNSLYLGGLTDNGTTTTGKKMLVRDTTTGATEVADVPSGGGGTTKIKYQATTNIANITGGTALSGSYFATKIIPEADIDVDKFEYYVTSVSAGKTVYCGIYDSAGTTLLGEASGNTDTLGEHETASISGGAVSLTGGQVYWLAVLEGSGSPNLGSKSAYSDSNLNRSAYVSATPTGMPSSIGGGFSTTTGFFIGVKA